MIKTYDLIEPTAPEASAATVEELVTCSWSGGSDLMQREKEESCGGSEIAVEKEEQEEEDADLDEVYAFMLTQRRNHMNRGGITEDKDNESDASERSVEDKDDSRMMTRSQSYSGSDDEGQDGLLLELSQAASFDEESRKSHKVMMGHASCYSARTSAECVSLGAKTFPDEILSKKKECSNVHVESSGGEVQQHSDLFLNDSVSESSNGAIELVVVEDEADRCLSEDTDADNDNDDDEEGVLPQKSGEEFVPGCSAGGKLYHRKDDSRETSYLLDGSCVSYDILRADSIVEQPLLDATDVCAFDNVDTSQHGGKEPMVSDTLILPLTSASSSSSSSCSFAQGLVLSSGSASDSIDTISNRASGVVSTCILSSDNLSPDLFPSSPCSESLASSVVSVQESCEPCVLLQAAKKLKNVLDTDEVFTQVLDTGESIIEYRRNLLTGGSGRDIERQTEAECEKYGHIAPAFKKISDCSIYLEKSILEVPCHSQVHTYCAQHQCLSQMGEKLTVDDFLPDLDDYDDDNKVQNPTEATCELSLTSNYMKNNNMTSNLNEIVDSMCSDEILFPHGMRTLNLSPGVEIGTRASEMNKFFQTRLVTHSKSSSPCRIISSTVTDKAENDCQMSDDKTDEIHNVETSDEEYCEKKRHRNCDNVADSAAKNDEYYDNKNATQHISDQCGDEASAAVFHSDGRISDMENIWENFPEEEFVPHVFFENEKNASHVCTKNIF